MANSSHEVKPLSDAERKAYRNLLYEAMLDIRNLCQPRGKESFNPIVWRRQYMQGRIAGALADWLHNLALIATVDFRSLDAEGFWREYDGVCRRYSDVVGNGKLMDYRHRYERHLAKQNTA
jgi:hypothetical protein